MTWVCPNCGSRYPDSGIGVPASADADDMVACEECNPWDWVPLLTRTGEMIPPGACERFQGGRDKQRDILDA